jgi:D-alanyl-D-alanine carboxypeptidase/D-alanyl-D-alanine-endopeptidase (penicillin-binding protein 4)
MVNKRTARMPLRGLIASIVVCAVACVVESSPVTMRFALAQPAASAGAAPSGHAPAAPAPAPTPIDARRSTKALEALRRAVRSKKGKLGVALLDLERGQLVIDENAEAAVNPASNMKVITAWAALRRLGPAWRFRTGLYGRQRGKRVAKLVLRGDGDPSLERRHLWEMVARLRRAGVREVGEILVDQSRFDTQFVPPAFAQQPSEWAAFRAPVAAVSLAANTVMLEVSPTEKGKPARVHLLPRSFVTVSGRVQTGDAGDPERVQLSLEADGPRLKAIIGGSVPAGSRTVRLWRRVDDPTLLAGYALRDLCEQLGITVKGAVSAGGESERGLLSMHRSKPMATLLRALGKHSNNFYAEMVFKRLGGGGPGAPASFAAAAKVVAQELGKVGVDTGRQRIENGSGLFDANRLSPAAIVAVLAAAHPWPFRFSSPTSRKAARLRFGATWTASSRPSRASSGPEPVMRRVIRPNYDLFVIAIDKSS